MTWSNYVGGTKTLTQTRRIASSIILILSFFTKAIADREPVPKKLS